MWFCKRFSFSFAGCKPVLKTEFPFPLVVVGVQSLSLCPTFCNPVDCSSPGFSVLHYLPEFAQIHVHWVSDAINIQPSHPLPPASPFALFSPASGSFTVSWLFASGARVLEFQLHQLSFHEYWGLIFFRIDWFDLLAVQGDF